MTYTVFPFTLDNRELSVVIWFAVFLGWVFWLKDVRNAVWAFIKVVFSWPILSFLGLALLWTAIGVLLLYQANFWELETLKTTLLWFVAISFGTMLDASKLETDKHYFRKTITDAVSLTAIITFAVGVYPFSLWVELLLVPGLIFLTLLTSAAKFRPENAPAYKPLQWILAIAGFFIAGHTLLSIAHDSGTLITLKNGREFGAPLVLTIWFIPFIFAFKVFNAYNTAQIRLAWVMAHRRMRRYARNRAWCVFGPDIYTLKDWLSYLQRNKLSRGQTSRQRSLNSIVEKSIVMIRQLPRP
jgi:hypothetical protein